MLPTARQWLSRNGNRSHPGSNASYSRPTRKGIESACWYASRPARDYPAHTHAGVEELHLLDGELWIDERKLFPGDYNYGAPGAGDERVWSETGCTLRSRYQYQRCASLTRHPVNTGSRRKYFLAWMSEGLTSRPLRALTFTRCIAGPIQELAFDVLKGMQDSDSLLHPATGEFERSLSSARPLLSDAANIVLVHHRYLILLADTRTAGLGGESSQ